jgi:hypothetical protein
MDDALGVLRLRARPLLSPMPWRRERSGHRQVLQVLTGIDHYARGLARLSDGLRAPDGGREWEAAVEQVRANLTALKPGGAGIRSAEELVDAAEASAARDRDPARRHGLLEAARLLRRIDQSTVSIVEAPAVTLGRR